MAEEVAEEEEGEGRRRREEAEGRGGGEGAEGDEGGEGGALEYCCVSLLGVLGDWRRSLALLWGKIDGRALALSLPCEAPIRIDLSGIPRALSWLPIVSHRSFS